MILVERADGSVLVQDLGRPTGWRHGVGCAGAFDLGAHLAGQRLVGNEPGDAALELTMATLQFVTTEPLVLAVTGAPCESRVDGAVVTTGATTAVPAGATVLIRPPVTGARVTCSLAGGIRADPVLGSRSTDTLAGIGPAPVRAGDELATQTAARPPAWRGVALASVIQEVVEAAPGPHAHMLGDLVVTGTVASTSNRGGVRINAGGRHEPRGDLASMPVMPGAVQLTPAGELIVLGPDAGITGGYPVVAVVDRGGLDRLAQRRPGDPVELRVSRPRAAR